VLAVLLVALHPRANTAQSAAAVLAVLGARALDPPADLPTEGPVWQLGGGRRGAVAQLRARAAALLRAARKAPGRLAAHLVALEAAGGAAPALAAVVRVPRAVRLRPVADGGERRGTDLVATPRVAVVQVEVLGPGGALRHAPPERAVLGEAGEARVLAALRAHAVVVDAVALPRLHGPALGALAELPAAPVLGVDVGRVGRAGDARGPAHRPPPVLLIALQPRVGAALG